MASLRLSIKQEKSWKKCMLFLFLFCFVLFVCLFFLLLFCFVLFLMNNVFHFKHTACTEGVLLKKGRISRGVYLFSRKKIDNKISVNWIDLLPILLGLMMNKNFWKANIFGNNWLKPCVYSIWTDFRLWHINNTTGFSYRLISVCSMR